MMNKSRRTRLIEYFKTSYSLYRYLSSRGILYYKDASSNTCTMIKNSQIFKCSVSKQSKVILSFENIIRLQISMFTCLNLSKFYYMQKYTVSCSSISNTPSAESFIL